MEARPSRAAVANNRHRWREEAFMVWVVEPGRLESEGKWAVHPGRI
jgi:hypothetical protein